MARLLLVFVVALAACRGEVVPEVLVVRAGRLVDGTGAPAVTNVRLLVVQGTITDIEPDRDDEPLPPGAAVLDARGLTVLPGLVDVHVHVSAPGSCTPGVGTGLGQVARNLHAMLAAGVTTAADLGAITQMAVGTRRWVGTGRGRGPRLLVAGAPLVAQNGYLTDLMDGELVKLGVLRPINGPDDARLAVREHVAAGVDLIKIALQRRGFDRKELPLPDAATVCAAVKEAHHQELRVLVHATEAATYDLALSCGPDALVHGLLEPADDALIERVRAAGVPVAPTLFVFDSLLWGPAHPEYLEARQRHRDRFARGGRRLAGVRRGLRSDGGALPTAIYSGIHRPDAVEGNSQLRAFTSRAYAAGIPLAMGTDSPSCFSIAGQPVRELSAMVEAGVPPLAALAAATSGGARLLGLGDAVGRVAEGYRGDLIAVEGRPDEDIGAIAAVRHVVLDGVVQTPVQPTLSTLAQLAFEIAWAFVGG